MDFPGGGRIEFPPHEFKDVTAEVERMGLRPREILREVSRKHIFTHIQWNMKGIYLEVAEASGGFSWFTAEQIDAQAALPTAFRLFWEEKERDV